MALQVARRLEDEHQVTHRNPVKAMVLIREAIDLGAEEADFAELARSAAGRVGLFWNWLEDPHRWKGVLDERGLQAKERGIRKRAPSVEVVGDPLPDQVTAESVKDAIGL